MLYTLHFCFFEDGFYEASAWGGSLILWVGNSGATWNRKPDQLFRPFDWSEPRVNMAKMNLSVGQILINGSILHLINGRYLLKAFNWHGPLFVGRVVNIEMYINNFSTSLGFIPAVQPPNRLVGKSSVSYHRLFGLFGNSIRYFVIGHSGIGWHIPQYLRTARMVKLFRSSTGWGLGNYRCYCLLVLILWNLNTANANPMIPFRSKCTKSTRAETSKSTQIWRIDNTRAQPTRTSCWRPYSWRSKRVPRGSR